MPGQPYPDSVGSSAPYPPRPERSRSPPRSEYPPDREFDDRSGFSRGGFAPLPHRHSDLPPLPPVPARGYEREDFDRGRGRGREFPRRELDPEPEERYERRDWDDYDRRAREIPPPHWDEEYDRPKRRRSPSPLGASHRPRMHSPSPPPSRYTPNLPDPALIETLLSFRQFAEWFRASHPQTAKNDEEETRKHREMIESATATEQQAKEKVGMAKRYERYRKEFHSRQLYALFLTHRDSIWFQERYSNTPEYIAFRRRLNRQGRVPLAEKHMEELRSGLWDTVEFDMADSDEKPSNKSRVNDHDEPEGLDRALGDRGDWVGDETLRAEIAPKPKQVFVKTAPPTTSRKELEELFARIPGFQWLAVSEPAQKKSFHRVAWAQFADDVDIGEVIQKLDGQKIDGFTFHMSVNSTPTIGRLRITPPVANTLDRLIADCEKAKALALKLEEELLGDEDEDEDKPEGESEAAPPKAEPLEKKVPGLREKPSEVVEETISKLLDTQALSIEGLDQDKQLRKAKVILDQWLAYLRHGLSTCYYCVAPMSFAEELHRKCIGHMRALPSPKSEIGTEQAPVENNGLEGEATAKADGEEGQRGPEEGEDERELRDAEDKDRPSKSTNSEAYGGGQHKRASFFPQKTQEEKWVDGLEVKLKPLLGEVDVVEYGGRDAEAETKKLCAPLIKQEEPSKYRCKDCNKLFRAPEFVIKHVIVKHPEVTKPKLDDVAMLNNYVLDPQHLQPTLSTLAAVEDKLPFAATMTGSNPMMMAVNPALASHSNGGHGQGMFDPSAMNMGGMGMGVMQQQMMMMMQMQQMMMGGMGMNMPGPGGAGSGAGNASNSSYGGREGAGLAARMGGYAGGVGDASRDAAPLPPVPAGGEDPRARRGRVSYQDLDEPGGAGDGGLPY